MDDNPVFVSEAQNFLNSEVFKDILKNLRKEAHNDIENSNPEQNALREQAYQELRALERIRAKLQGYPDNHRIVESRKR